MRFPIRFALALIALPPAPLAAQDPEPARAPVHVAVEASTLVLDQARVRRLGLDGIVLESTSAVHVVPRVGGLSVSAWLQLVRRERAVRRESTQRIVTLSGSPASVSGGRTVLGPYGQSASAGPELWVEPTVLPDGRVRLRVWAAVGEVRADPFGAVWQEVPAEARTEVVVPSGTTVLVASSEQHEQRTHRGLLERGSADARTQAWIVVTPRVVADPAQAFPLPEGIPAEWIRR